MYSLGKRHKLIQDALIGMINIYPVGKASLFPLVDMLHLLVQEPVSISFFGKTRSKTKPYSLKYTSMQDPELKPLFQQSIESDPKLERNTIRIPRTNYYICLHTIDMSSGISKAQFSTEKFKIFKNLFEDLVTNEHGKEVIEKLKSGLKNYSANEMPGKEFFPEKEISSRAELSSIENMSKWMTEKIKPMRQALDNAYLDIMDSPLIFNKIEGKRKKEKQRLDFSNLYCVIRTATNLNPRRGIFNYTARLLLSNKQKMQINEWCSKKAKFCDFKEGLSCTRGGALKCIVKNLDFNSNEICERLEIPLGDNARSIADSVFCSGVIDFSAERAGEGRDDSGQPESFNDMIRQKVEHCIYGQITESPHVFYIPIHVAGVPWLALFTLSPRPNGKNDDSTSWAHNYQVYRTLIPQIATKLRSGAKQAFLQLVGELLSTHLDHRNFNTFLEEVNRDWSFLTYVYPFNRIELLSKKQAGAFPLELPDKRIVWLCMHERNPNFYQQVEFELLDFQDVIAECKKVVDQFAVAKFSQIESTKNEISLLSSHDLRNTLRNAVIAPLDEACKLLEAKSSLQEIKIKIDDAKMCVENYSINLSYLLNGFVDLFDPKSPADPQVITSDNCSALTTPQFLMLENYSSLPTITFTVKEDAEIDLNISKRSFSALLHVIVANAIDAMRGEGLNIELQKVEINARRVQTERGDFCELIIWNSNTFFTQAVIDQTGVRPYTTRIGKGRSGLGLYILEKVLEMARAFPQVGDRHFRLENTSNPVGAQVLFSIPVKGS